MTTPEHSTYRLAVAYRTAGRQWVSSRGGIAELPETRVLRDLTEALGCSETQAYRWLDDGVLPGEQIAPDARWRCAREAFVCWLATDGYLTNFRDTAETAA